MNSLPSEITRCVEFQLLMDLVDAFHLVEKVQVKYVTESKEFQSLLEMYAENTLTDQTKRSLAQPAINKLENDAFALLFLEQTQLRTTLNARISDFGIRHEAHEQEIYDHFHEVMKKPS